jgi:acetyltransferase
VHVSQLVVEQPWIKEVTINPLLLSSEACQGLNVTVALHGAELGEELLPRPAIRPYPVQYVSAWRTNRGDSVTIRPIQPEDEPLMIKFHERLSDQSVYLRYFQMVGLARRTAHDRLTRICFIDYDREMALVAEQRDPQTEERRIVGLGNLGRVRGSNDGEVAVIVSDDYQGHGLGTELMRRLVQVARMERMTRVLASTMVENKPTIAVLKRVGFNVTVNFEDHLVDAEMNL